MPIAYLPIEIFFVMVAAFVVYVIVLTVRNNAKKKHLSELLVKEEEYFENIFKESPIGICLYDADGKLILANGACLSILGVPHFSEIEGVELFEDPNLPEEIKIRLRAGEAVHFEGDYDFEKVKRSKLYKTVKSGLMAVDVAVKPLHFEDTRTVSGYLTHVRDITERKKDEEIIKQQQTFLQNAIESIPNPFYIIDASDYTVKLANSAARAGSEGSTLTCYTLTHRCGKPCVGEPGHPCPLEKVKASRRPVVVEHAHAEKNGMTRYYEVHGYPILDPQGNVAQMIEYSIDITERKKMEEELRAISLIDDLTGLYNRRGFRILAEKQLAIAARTVKKLLFIMADIDNMKLINDTFGHKEGDIALINVNNILRYTFRESDIIARIGGDEFVVLSTGNGENNAQVIASRLAENFETQNKRNYRGYRLSISVGMAYYDPEQHLGLEEVLDSADKLMYQQKAAKKKIAT